MDLEQIDLNKVCRTCKNPSEAMSSLFENTENVNENPHLDEMLMAFTSIQIRSGDGLPSNICQLCIDQLKNAFAFKKQCEQTDTSLRMYLKSLKLGEIKEELQNTEFFVSIDNFLSTDLSTIHQQTESYEDDFVQLLDNNQFIFTCRWCQGVFKSVESLRSHRILSNGTFKCTNQSDVKDVIQKQDFIKLLDNDQMILTCQECTKLFTSLDNFRIHKRTHNGVLFKCKQCDKEYTRLNSLQRHELSHSNQKVHVCRICNKTLTRSDHLKRHLTTHLKEKPFSCMKCNRGFSRYEHLNNHLPKCKGEKVHICNVCNKVFYREDSLELHKKLHENQQPSLPTIENLDNIEKHYYEIDYDDNVVFSDSEQEEDDIVEKSTVVDSKPIEQATEISDNCDNNDEETAANSDMEYLPHRVPKKRGRGRPRKNSFAVGGKLNKSRRGRPPIIKDEEETGDFPCPICDNMFTSLSQLNKHARIEHEQVQKFKCKVCDKEFNRLNHLKRHNLSHSETKPYDCDVCAKSFARKDHLTQHRKSHEKQQQRFEFECDLCEKSFNRAELLTKHKVTKHGVGEKMPLEKKHECPICKKLFTTEKYRDVHVKGHNGEKRHQCKTCNKFFLSKSHLNEHMKFHDDHSKKFLCSECGQRFIRNDYLVIHMRRHRGEKPFKCKYCGKGFPRTTDLTVHERYHTGEKTHLCTICGRGFGRAYNLTVHMRTHTGEKPYQCTYCEAAFAQGNDLKAHIRRHTGERFHCELCSESFLMGYLLTQHKRNVHGLNVVSNIRRLKPVHKKEENPDEPPPIEIPLPKPVVPENVFNSFHQSHFVDVNAIPIPKQ